MKNTLTKIKQFTQERDWDQFHSPANLAKSISIEASELLECFQWSDEYDRDAVISELEDVVNYAILMVDEPGVDFEEILLEKLRRNEEK